MLPILWIPAAIMGATALAGAIGQVIAKKKAAKKQREFALQQFNQAQEYNSPKAQMERFKIAGLNPNLIYGSGQAAAGTYEAQSADGQGGEFQPLDLAKVGGAIGSVYDLSMKKAGMDKMEAETRRTNQESEIQYQKWLVEKLYLAKNAGNQSDVLEYTKQLKELEASDELGAHKYHQDIHGDVITKDGKNIAKGYSEAQIIRKQQTAAIAKIKAESSNITERNNRIRKLNKFIEDLPSGINVTKAIQVFLLTLLK